MNNIEKNALRIAELTGWEHNPIFNRNTRNCIGLKDAVQIKTNEELIELYCSYNGLMPIVFECGNIQKYAIEFLITGISVGKYIKGTYVEIDGYGYGTEEEFIEAIQLACIKYLELKNVQ